MKWARMRALVVIRNFSTRARILAVAYAVVRRVALFVLDWSLDGHARVAGEKGRRSWLHLLCVPQSPWGAGRAVLYLAARLCFIP